MGGDVHLQGQFTLPESCLQDQEHSCGSPLECPQTEVRRPATISQHGQRSTLQALGIQIQLRFMDCCRFVLLLGSGRRGLQALGPDRHSVRAAVRYTACAYDAAICQTNCALPCAPSSQEGQQFSQNLFVLSSITGDSGLGFRVSSLNPVHWAGGIKRF